MTRFFNSLATSPTLRLFVIVGVLVLGAALRIVNITQADIWFDEGFSYYAIKVPDMMGALLRDDHPPTYFAMLKLWITFVGQSEFGLRSLSAIFSILTMAMVVPLAKEIMRHRPHPQQWLFPLLALIVIAMLDMQQYIAQETRMYAQYVFFAAVSMWAFLRWLRTTDRITAIVWVVFTALCPWTHYLGVWTGVTQGIYILIFVHGQKRWLALSGLIIAALTFLPWLLIAVIPYQFQKVGTQVIGTKSNLDTIKGFIEVFLSKQWVLLVAYMLFGSVTILYDRAKTTGYLLVWRGWQIVVLLWLWILVPFWLTFLFNVEFDILADHRLAQLDLPIALLIAYGLCNVPSPSRRVLVVALIVYSTLHFDIYLPRQPWAAFGRNASQFIEVGDGVLIDVAGGDYQLEYYIDRFAPQGIDVRSVKRWQTWYPDSFQSDIRAYLEPLETFWFVRWSNTDMTQIATELGFTQTGIQLTPDWGEDWVTMRYDKINVKTPLVTFENGMELLQIEFDSTRLQVDFWWRINQTLTKNYTVSAFLLDANGTLVAQWDSFPYLGNSETNQWNTSSIYWDPHKMIATQPLIVGNYQLGVSVYENTANGITNMQPQDNDASFAILQEVILP